MFPCRPPFSYSGVGEIVAHGSFDSVPQRFLQRTVTIVNEHAFTVSCESGEECAETEFVWSVKIVEAAHALQKKHCKLAAFLRRFDQLVQLGRRWFHRWVSSFCVRVQCSDRIPSAFFLRQ